MLAIHQPKNRSKRVERSQAEKSVRAMAEKWPSALIPRTKVSDFTGGLYSGAYLANRDSLGEGPEKKFRVGRQTVYPVDSFIEWLINRLEA